MVTAGMTTTTNAANEGLGLDDTTTANQDAFKGLEKEISNLKNQVLGQI